MTSLRLLLFTFSFCRCCSFTAAVELVGVFCVVYAAAVVCEIALPPVVSADERVAEVCVLCSVAPVHGLLCACSLCTYIAMNLCSCWSLCCLRKL